jgi:GT2 family glycosyltransferase/ubiquinone/menaquinone biosynthesis C-methylase UbiE/glycosyltransferase involved in cell wall biosynthesis
MEFTGERYIPTLKGQIRYEHLHRYASACEFVRNKSVLDIACGEGFGANLLAQYAKSVVGVDIDSGCIKHAKHTYYRSNLKFLEGSCDAIPLQNNSIDIVVSFETIEHHDKHEEMMREIKRVLSPDGTLIISSPSKYEYSERVNFTNEFHTKELYYDEFLKLLELYFSKITVFGQKISAGSFIFPLHETTEKNLKSYSGDEVKLEENFAIPGRPVYYIAFCSDQVNYELKSSLFFDRSDDIFAALNEDRRLASQLLQECSQKLSTLNESLYKESESSLESLRKELDACKNELNDLKSEKDSRFADLKKRSEQEQTSVKWFFTSRLGKFCTLLRRFELRFYSLLGWKLGLRRSPFHYALDLPQNSVTIGEKMDVAGWIFSDVGFVVRLDVFLDGYFLGTMNWGVGRPDVAAVFPSHSSKCGFKASFFVPSFFLPANNSKTLVIRAFDDKGNKAFIKRTVNVNDQFGNFEKASLLPGDLAGEVLDLEDQTIKVALPPSRSLWLNTTPMATLSIIIPVFNKSQYTFACLDSLRRELERSSSAPFVEVIVVDDGSTDDTAAMLDRITGVKIIRNPRNLGFIKACNYGAAEAVGKYLLFLNNDTLVQPKCLERMVETFQNFTNVGLVGAKLLYPNGCLQEAGGIVWQDGSAWNYGRLDDPNKPEYSHARSVDYCSGACLMIPSGLFKDLNGFDEYYAPAYYEDTDLAFRVREAGYQVIFQPSAQVVHFEGVTSGKETTSGVKSYQITNKKKFFERWQRTLSKHAPNGVNVYQERDRAVSRRILVLDACVLTPDQDAGSQNVHNYIQIFCSLGFKVTFAPDNLQYHEHYTEALQRIGVECLYSPYTTSIRDYLEEYGKFYDCVFICRFNIALNHISSVRVLCPNAKIIFNTEDLHHLREIRRAEIDKNLEAKKIALAHKDQELEIVRQADYTLVVSHFEKEILAQECPDSPVQVIPMPREIYGCRAGFEKRCDILFIGGFQHTPNVDAILYFTSQIFPRIKVALPSVKLYILGSKPPSEVRKLASEDIIVTGYLPDISVYFDRCRVFVAPLRYGAGVKGKLLTSFCYGVPAVATEIACEGMRLAHEKNVLIGKNPSEFADYVVALYTDHGLWKQLSENGLNLVEQHYSFEAAFQTFGLLFANLGIEH